MKIKTLFLLTLSLALLAPAAAPAAAAVSDTVQSTRLVSEVSTPLTPAEARAFFSGPGAEQKVLVIPAILIVMAGAKVWSVIMDNRPSATLGSSYASAIPGFNFNWDELAGWRKVTKTYRFAIDTKTQGRAVDILYEVSFFHGAIPHPDKPALKGQYITNFTVKPGNINLKWGWKVSLDADMSDPMNVGTPLEPVAWLNADLKWQYTKPLSTKPQICVNTLSIDGLGNLSETNYGEMNISPVRSEETSGPAPVIKWN